MEMENRLRRITERMSVPPADPLDLKVKILAQRARLWVAPERGHSKSAEFKVTKV
jgi:hypothetical protein